MTLTPKQLQYNEIAAKHNLPEVFSKDDCITWFWINNGYYKVRSLINIGENNE